MWRQHSVENSMPDVTKRRVDNAAMGAGLGTKRCLIENTAESNHVDYVHCLPRSTKGPLLDILEFAWNTERGTLNVDTRYNIFHLSAKFHRAFDAGRWLLLPETSILDIYLDGIRTGTFPNINNDVYKYTLIALPDMSKVPIHRQKFPPPSQPSAADFTFYPHPYHDFPVITLHVHPRFIICNSGPKLEGNITLLQTDYGMRCQDMAKVQDIWQSWRKTVPTRQFLNKLSCDDDPSIEDDGSQKTTPHGSTRRKCKAREEQALPTSMDSKQQRLADCAWLGDKTLEQLASSNDNQVDFRFILDWLNSVSYLEGQIDVDEKTDSIGDSYVIIDSDGDFGVEDTQMPDAHLAESP